jgi:hypothetical protein
MSDRSVREALRSDAPLVVVEAPAGCGKTYQGAEYAREATATHPRPLTLTHTHAACAVFAERTKGAGSRIEIRTIDSIIASIASAYHAGLGLPADVGSWARAEHDGYAKVASKVTTLLERHPMISTSLARRHGVVVCDEHQDCSGDQHAVAMALLRQGARVRVFADPVQKIFREKPIPGGNPPWDWTTLTKNADAFEQLDHPHRWSNGCAKLGDWTLKARAALAAGGKIDLRGGLPESVHVVVAENQAQKNLEYQLASADRKPIDAFEKSARSVLILTRHNATARSFRGFFGRRIPLWEGHTRDGLEQLMNAARAGAGNAEATARALVQFMRDVGKGFSPSAFGNLLEREAREGCKQKRTGKPGQVQELARFLVAEPDHRGIAKALGRLAELKESDAAFADVEIDGRREFFDAVRMGDFDAVDVGLTEIHRRRTYARPKPPDRAISTIHKAKGLECSSVIVMPCDAKTFPDKQDARCLLYVALSRAWSELLLVVSRQNPSPLFTL